MESPLAEYKFMGMGKIVLFPNRIEIVRHKLGFSRFPKIDVIPISRIANVYYEKFRQPFLRITTNDGGNYEPRMFHWQAEDLHKRLMELL